ncbi:MAG: substrate-binding domain-containing protein [Tissierellia bacterium]|nr:substrate-binding domain-containing protein [Tissierellia bacterium]
MQTQPKQLKRRMMRMQQMILMQYSDTYTSTVRSALEKYAGEMNLDLNLQDAQNNQGMQNDQIPNVISRGVDVILMNIVDTGAAANVIDQAKAADLPIIFFNREPEDIGVYATYDQSRFVGTKKEDAGIIQGDMIAELWNTDVAKYDRNGNGKLDYVMLHGGLDNAEAIARTEYSVKTIEEAGIEVNEIGMQIANWDSEKAKNAMDAWLAKNQL